MSAITQGVRQRIRAFAGATFVRATMRVLARWLAFRAAVPPEPEHAPLPVAVRGARAMVVVALAEAGDMVLLSVFLRELRRLSAARVTLVCLPGVRVLFERSPDVDEIIVYDAAMPRFLRPLVLPRRARKFARRELGRPFDVAIVPRWDTDQHLAAAVSLFSRAPRRVWHSEQSNDRKRTLNAGFDTLFTDVVMSPGVKHEVERHLDMLRALGATTPSTSLGMALSEDDRQRAAGALSQVGEGRHLVALGIGAAHPRRRWALSKFAEVGRVLQRDHGAYLVIVGGPTDMKAQADLLRQLDREAIGVAGRLTLRESAAVIERCRLFIGSDSAPMHLAAATGVSCVQISCHPAGGDPLHNNAPDRFAPWGVPNVVVRPAAPVPPCTSSCAAAAPHCILAVTPATVLDAASSLLQQISAAGSRASAASRA